VSGLKRKGCPDNAGIDVRIAPVYAGKDGIFIEARKECLLVYKDEGGEFADYENLYKEAESINNFLR